MPEVLTQSWELAILGSAHEFVSGIMTKYEGNKDTAPMFKRGPTIFISKRLPTDEDEE